MNLAEIIAAKRKAALAKIVPQEVAQEAVQEAAIQVVTITHPVETVIETKAAAPALTVPEPLISDAKRVLSFSEKMALRKNATEVVAEVASVQKVNPILPEAFQNKVQEKIVAVLKDAREQEDMQRAEYQQATEETRKSYKDIRNLVDSLKDTEDNDLANAMTDLKKSLIQNPSACMLMLDEEIGSMTIALRRLTQEAMVAAIKEPKEKKVAKDKVMKLNLTPEQMQRALDEL